MNQERGNGGDDQLAKAVADLLGSRSMACCESFTAGRVAAGLARGPRATTWLRGGLVSYQESVKRDLLGVAAPSVYSEAAAKEMALAIARILNAEVAIATTGVAGDEAMDGVAPGTAFVATIVDGDVRAATQQFDGSAESVCAAATTFALGMPRAHLAGESHADGYPSDDTYEHRREVTTDLLAFDSGYD